MGVKIKDPKKGQFVFDKYSKRRTMVVGISGGLFFVGSDHEPIKRDEFIFPLPTAKKKKTIKRKK